MFMAFLKVVTRRYTSSIKYYSNHCHISDPPTSTAQRQYILVGKVLQNLSNNTLPGAKEEYMSKLSEFITNNQDELQRFYDDLLVC